MLAKFDKIVAVNDDIRVLKYRYIKMGKRIALFIIMLLSFTALYAQEVKKVDISYDEDFRPTVNLTVTNPTNKTITTIEFTVAYKLPGSHPNNIFAFHYTQYIQKIVISPNQEKNFPISITTKYGNYELYSIWIKRVRFSDGTIKEISKY